MKKKEEKGADYGNMNLNIELNPGEKVTVSRTENKAEENIHLSIKKVIKNETKDENNKNAARENQIKQKNSVGKTEQQNTNQLNNERDTIKQQQYNRNRQKPEQQVNEIEKQKNYLEPKKENQREIDDINPILQDSNKVEIGEQIQHGKFEDEVNKTRPSKDIKLKIEDYAADSDEEELERYSFI